MLHYYLTYCTGAGLSPWQLLTRTSSVSVVFDDLVAEILRNIIYESHHAYDASSSLEVLNHFSTCRRICSRRLLKTKWQKKKLLITSNFSFCHIVFNSIKNILLLIEFSFFLLRCFQTRLLADCLYVRKD